MMTLLTSSSDPSPYLDLANQLLVYQGATTISKKLRYHLQGRATLIKASLLSLASMIGRLFVGIAALAVHGLSMLRCQSAKDFGLRQIRAGAESGCMSYIFFRSLYSPMRLAYHLLRLDSNLWVKESSFQPVEETRIPTKLAKEFASAQAQAKAELDKQFKIHSIDPEKATEVQLAAVGSHRYAVFHDIGLKDKMENKHLSASFDLFLEDNVYHVELYGIFDGHGGGQAAQYASENLANVLHQTLYQCCQSKLTDAGIWNALKQSFVTLNHDFKEKFSGTTATVAMLLDGKIWVANVGDSRTILDNGIQLSEDAKPSDPKYRRGIERRGGTVSNNRINGNLAVARALGDHRVIGVNAHPKIICYPLSSVPQGTRLILGCDGIFDVASTRQVASASKTSNLDMATFVCTLVYSARMHGSTDNLSAMAIQF